jgi:hypothetical protein
MTEVLWKKTEREVAARLGGQRVPVSGRARGDAPDVKHDWLSVEVKSKHTLPHWLRDALAQARASAGVSQLPIAVLHENGARHDGDLVVMSLKDFCDWFGGEDGRSD